MAWTDERCELLDELWAGGYSASLIAQKLGDVTRCAVIGKAHRRGLAGRMPAPAPRVPRVRLPFPRRPARRPLMQTVPEKPQPPAAPLDPSTNAQERDSEIPLSRRKSLLQLQNHHCHWPIGELGAGLFFCGHPSANLRVGRPYCARHEAASKAKVQRRPGSFLSPFRAVRGPA